MRSRMLIAIAGTTSLAGAFLGCVASDPAPRVENASESDSGSAIDAGADTGQSLDASSDTDAPNDAPTDAGSDAAVDAGTWSGAGHPCTFSSDCSPPTAIPWCVNGYCVTRLCDSQCLEEGGTCEPDHDGGAPTLCEVRR